MTQHEVGEKFIMRSFTTFLRAKYNQNNKGKEDEMGRACSIHEENMHVYRVLVGNPERKRPLGRLNMGGKIILKWILEKWDGVPDGLDSSGSG
jgi:hypothetical protein